MDYQFHAGGIPLLVSMPHVGVDIPDEIAARMTPQALAKGDTDWHLRELHGFLQGMDASVLSARWSRYVIDLNWPARYSGSRWKVSVGSRPVVSWPGYRFVSSRVPRFFDGKLPDLNFGTADGASCDAGLTDAVVGLARDSQFTVALNGRFKGGHITRHYGQPASRVHGIQLEMCQCLYMDETVPFAYRPDLAQQVQPLLQNMMEAAVAWVRR